MHFRFTNDPYLDLCIGFLKNAGTEPTPREAIGLSLYHFLSIQYMYGDLCKHLGIDSSTDHPLIRFDSLLL